MSPNTPNTPQVPAPHSVVHHTPAAPQAVQPAVQYAEDAGLNWGRVKSALWRYKWMVVLVTVVGSAGGLAYARMVRPMYSASTTIWIDGVSRDGGERGPIRSPRLFDAESWVDLVRSYAVLDSVVRDTHLNVSFAKPVSREFESRFGLVDGFATGGFHLLTDSVGTTFRLTRGDGTEIERGTLGDSIGRTLGWRWAPPASAFPSEKDITIGVGSLRARARGLAEQLRPRIGEDGKMLHVDLDDTDPVRLANILNAVSRRYATLISDLKRQRQASLGRILAGQMDYAKRTLTDAESALAAFRVRTITLPDDPGVGGRGAAPGGMGLGFFDMQVELSQLKLERATLARLLSAAPDSGMQTMPFERLQSVQQSTELRSAFEELTKKRADLRTLGYAYYDAHPEVVKAKTVIASLERVTIPTLLNRLDAEMTKREQYLEREVATKGESMRAVPQRAVELVRLQRSVTSADNLYNMLNQRLAEAQIAEVASGIADVRTLDAAVAPTSPVSDTTPRILFLAFFGSLGMASVGAVLLDRVDSKFRYPDQVSRELGLTILGAVPHSRAAADGVDSLQDNPPLLEAMRAIRLNLVYAYGTAGPMVFTVTSPGRGEGKTFLTSHLARVFAESGQRTLVIEGDLRRGLLHRRLSVSRRPGLADYLRGDAAIDQIVQKTKFAHLSVITGGTRFHDAPELLGTQAMAQLLASLRSRFDVILCDSPPLGAGIDPLVLATATGNLLLLLRTGVSHRDLTEAKLEVISRMPIRLLGAVLNDVPRDIVFSYYSYYLPGYETSDEGRPALPSAAKAT